MNLYKRPEVTELKKWRSGPRNKMPVEGVAKLETAGVGFETAVTQRSVQSQRQLKIVTWPLQQNIVKFGMQSQKTR